jgi:hypothetical protein
MTKTAIRVSDPARQDGVLWSNYPVWSDVAIGRDGWQARPVLGLDQLTINGDVHAARAALAPDAKEVGLWGKADGGTYTVRLARACALLVSRQLIETNEAWQPTGWIARRSDDAYLVIELSGPAVGEVVSEGTSVDINSGSPSASVLFAGVIVALYRSRDDRVRVHVPSDLAPYLWRWLETR